MKLGRNWAMTTWLVVTSLILYLTSAEKLCHNGTERCYWFSGTGSHTWNEARSVCQSQGGDLAVMETEELWEFVSQTFELTITDMWFGLQKSPHDGVGVYRWLNNAALYYNKWELGQPDHPGSSPCGLIMGGLWHDAPCSWTPPPLGFCSTVAPECDNPLDRCATIDRTETQEDGAWILSEPQDGATFEEAVSFCKSRGQHLLMIKTKQKEEQVKQHHQTELMTLIGLTDSEVEGVFRWSDGQLASWTNWDEDEPQGAPEYDCVRRAAAEGVWRERACNNKEFYCETYEPGYIHIQTFYYQFEGLVVSNHVVAAMIVADQSECTRLCLRQLVCRAFSLAENMTCTIGSTNHMEDTSPGSGVLFYNTLVY